MTAVHETEWQYSPGLHAPQPVAAHGWYVSSGNLLAAAWQASGVVTTDVCCEVLPALPCSSSSCV